MARRRRRRSRGLLSKPLRLLLLVVVAVVGWWIHRGGLESLPTDSPSTVSSPGEEYDRKTWRHWVDDDGDCQDTRQEVLIAESEIPVKFKTKRRCKVRSGRWRCPYTGRTLTDPRKLDIDHLVPLAEAHRSGGHAWDRSQRERYANDLERPEHLVAVERGSNRSKADKGPDAWMPSAEGYRCEYLSSWIAVKERWRLQMDPAERHYVQLAQKACERGEVPALPQTQK